MPAAGDEKANFGGHISVPLLHVRRRLPLFTQSASSAVPDSAAGYRCAGNGLSLPAIGCSPVPPPARPLPAPKLLGLFRAAGGSNRPGSPSPAPRQISPPAVTTQTPPPPSSTPHPLEATSERRPRRRARRAAALTDPARGRGAGRRAERASGSGGREHARAQPNHGAGRGGGCAGARA